MNKEEVFNELCEEGKKITGIDVRLAPRRKKENIHLRASIMVILMNYFGVTTTSAGKLFNRDHTTAVHHRANHQWRYRCDDEYADIYDRLVRYVVAINKDKSQVDLSEILGLIKMIA
jgi:chromosomal replication initiation ATPase DnaA